MQPSLILMCVFLYNNVGKGGNFGVNERMKDITQQPSPVAIQLAQ